MTKNELKNLIKECYTEVIAENELPTTGPEYRNEPVSNENPVLSSDEKIKKTLEAWKAWGEKMKFLKDIRNEPEMVKKLDALISASSKIDKITIKNPVG